jgi:hypothetical protein
MDIAMTSFRIAVGQASSFGLAPAPGMIWTARDGLHFEPGHEVHEATQARYGKAPARPRTSSQAQFYAKLRQWGLDVGRRGRTTVRHPHRRMSGCGAVREAHGLC